MALSKGDALASATLLKIGENGPEGVDLGALCAGKKVVIFALPGAFTGTCTNAHLPSFMRNEDALRAKGVDEIICVSVNDPFVMDSWAKSTGADASGIHMLGDADGTFARGMDLAFTVPAVGFFDRLQRSAMIVENGVIAHIDVDENPGECNLSAGEAILDAL